jgi:hypothetical protein
VAPSPSSAQLHQAAQALILQQVPTAVARAWPQFNPAQINATMPRLTVVITAILRQFGLASSVHAAQFYKSQRTAAGVLGRFQVPVPPLPPQEQVEAELRWAVNDLYKAAEPAPKSSPTYDLRPYIVAPEAEQAALTKVQGVTEKLVLDQSRKTLLGAVKKDPKAKGWARVPEPGACPFCLMLATRGAVYRTKATADFRSHDHCKCHVEPLFSSHYEPTATVRAAEALYKQSAHTGPSDALNNFRVALQRERDAGRFAG